MAIASALLALEWERKTRDTAKPFIGSADYRDQALLPM
jgi:hypothetical protein